jgi:hypothetical protein
MTLETIIFSIFGSLLGKLLLLRTLVDLPKQKRPHITSFAFLLSALIDVILGLAFTYVQFRIANMKDSILLAIQISATAPLIASSIMKAIPTNSVYGSENKLG